jgi:hypothetical protein
MTAPTPALVFSLVCVIVGCAQLPHSKLEGTDSLAVQIIGERVRITARNGKDAPLEDFLRIAQAVTGKIITYPKQTIVSQRVELSEPLDVQRGEFLKRFTSILYTCHELACVIRGEGDSEFVDVISFSGGGCPEIAVGAMYVQASKLGKRCRHEGVEVLTSIPLHHITATAAEKMLRKSLPEVVRMGGTGSNHSISLQGQGPRVYDAVEMLRKFDVSKGSGKPPGN